MYDIKLNPEKCVFGVPAGKLLGFIVSNKGIEANPAKIRALSQLATPTDLKQVQKLAGCVAALSHFISRLGEKVLPLYRLLRHADNFEWTDAGTAGLEEIKTLLASNPILAAPNAGEPMLLYISATHERRARRRTRTGRTQIPTSKTSILRIYCPHTVQIPVPPLPKDSIRGLHGIPQATTLLPGVFNHGGF